MKRIKGTRLFLAITLGLLSVGAAMPALAMTHTRLSLVAESITPVVHQSVYYNLDAASALIERKQYPDAIVILQRVVEKDPINIFAQFNLGFCYLEMAKIAEERAASGQSAAGNDARLKALLKKAEYHFQRVQNLNPDLTVSYFKLGKIALMLNDSQAAEEYYKAGMDLDEQSAPLAFNLGRVYDQSGQTAKAITMYRKAIAIDPSFIFAYNNLGLLYEAQKNQADAEKAYQAALKQDPTYHYARLNLGNLYAEMGKLVDAKRQYDEVIRQEPKNSWAHLYLGNVYFLGGNYQAATRSYQSSIALNPQFTAAYYLLAISLTKQNRVDEALTASLKYMNLEPEGKYSDQLRSLIGTLKVYRAGAPAAAIRPEGQ